MATLCKLFASFFQIGLFTFGGGYAMLPMLKREVVEKHGWATEEQLLDCYAIAQCTPGVIAVNTATYIGFREKKLAGAVTSTFAVVLPSLLIISVIATVLQHFADHPYVVHAFGGIRVAVAALVVHAVVQLWQKGVKGAYANVLCIAAFAVTVLFGVSPVALVLCAAALGIARALMGGRKK